MSEIDTRTQRFPHRANRDGTIDSICPRCFVTVGTSNWEPELERLESAHVCEPSGLSYEVQRPKAVTSEPLRGPGKNSGEVEAPSSHRR